jgi:hypothetical protein
MRKLISWAERSISSASMCEARTAQKANKVLAAPLDSHRLLMSWSCATLVKNAPICVFCNFVWKVIDGGSRGASNTATGHDVGRDK